jgi:hypothetical protein
MNDTVTLSVGRSKTVCGREIKQAPIGLYLKTLTKLQNMPDEFLSACFPGKDLSEVLEELSNLTQEKLAALLWIAVNRAPKYVIETVSELTGISGDDLTDDPEIGVAGLIDIILAFIEVNRLGELRAGIKQITSKLYPKPPKADRAGSKI